MEKEYLFNNIFKAMSMKKEVTRLTVHLLNQRSDPCGLPTYIFMYSLGFRIHQFQQQRTMIIF